MTFLNSLSLLRLSLLLSWLFHHQAQPCPHPCSYQQKLSWPFLCLSPFQIPCCLYPRSQVTPLFFHYLHFLLLTLLDPIPLLLLQNFHLIPWSLTLKITSLNLNEFTKPLPNIPFLIQLNLHVLPKPLNRLNGGKPCLTSWQPFFAMEHGSSFHHLSLKISLVVSRSSA